jgi:hypothetical protein
MVTKAHKLGLSPGWYLNNCGCAENHFDEAMVEKVMKVRCCSSFQQRALFG